MKKGWLFLMTGFLAGLFYAAACGSSSGSRGGITPSLAGVIGNAIDILFNNTSSGLTATTVQGAIDELDARLDALDGGSTSASGSTSGTSGTVSSGGSISSNGAPLSSADVAVTKTDGTIQHFNFDSNNHLTIDIPRNDIELIVVAGCEGFGERGIDEFLADPYFEVKKQCPQNNW